LPNGDMFPQWKPQVVAVGDIVESITLMPSPPPTSQLSLFGRQPNRSRPQYISASRRTDLPRFFHREFLAAWEQGSITYDGGYGRSYTISLKTEDVLGYIFLSKDYTPLLADPRFRWLLAENNAIFHFTLNDSPDLEPGVASLTERVALFSRLCELVGPERVLWRFDPLCKYGLPGSPVRSNEAGFYRLLPILAREGIDRCYFSFMTLYPKLKRRQAGFIEFTSQEKQLLTMKMQQAARQEGVTLYGCCNPELAELAPAIPQARCVDNELLAATDRFGRHQPLAPQATRKGCGCFQCRDIGSYRQRCPHGCLYCYANPLTRR
jgi:hypothetical protein